MPVLRRRAAPPRPGLGPARPLQRAAYTMRSTRTPRPIRPAPPAPFFCRPCPGPGFALVSSHPKVDEDPAPRRRTPFSRPRLGRRPTRTRVAPPQYGSTRAQASVPALRRAVRVACPALDLGSSAWSRPRHRSRRALAPFQDGRRPRPSSGLPARTLATRPLPSISTSSGPAPPPARYASTRYCGSTRWPCNTYCGANKTKISYQYLRRQTPPSRKPNHRSKQSEPTHPP